MMRNTRSDMMKRTMVVGALALLLGACSSVPKELAYEPENQLVAYQPALGGMEGKPARWSGVISAVHNKADQSVIEVVYLPLKSNGVPEQTEQSPGRFLAIMKGFVDPTLYAKGAQPDGAWHHRPTG
ncbi:Outer membrane protein Slp [Aeromonas veronii]